jgi:hypothetical protein
MIKTSDNVLQPVRVGNFVNYIPTRLVPPNPQSWPLQRHPLNPVLSLDPDDVYERRMNELAQMEHSGHSEIGSRFNGFKYRSANLQSGIDNFRAIPDTSTNPNEPYSVVESYREKAQVSHYNAGSGRLTAGDVAVGMHSHVNFAGLPDLDMRSGRTVGHSHPPGPHTVWQPSLRDQLTARQLPHLQNFVKVPDVDRKPELDILQFSGAYPPRHYISLPNPQGHRVRRDSPDIPPSPGGTPRYPPFKNPPASYQGARVAYPGPHGYDSRSPSPDGEAQTDR